MRRVETRTVARAGLSTATRRRAWSAMIVGLAGVVAGASSARAAPTLITTSPAIDPDTGELIAFIGGIDDNGRSLKASGVEVAPDGAREGLPAPGQPLADFATIASEHSQTWRPPVVVGLVYLWIDGAPSGILDGVHAFFQRVPSRTTVLPTVYGRLRQGRASLAAADISRLDEVPHLETYRPNLIEAVRLDLQDLAAYPAPIKLLLVITDGRDYADPKGQGPGDFAALGREIRKAGVTPLVVGFPPSDVDAPQSAANLRELHDAAGGFVRMLDQSDDLENTLESLGQAVGDLQRVSLPLPWTWKVLGGPRRISLRLMTSGGRRLTADVGKIEVAAGPAIWVVAAVGLGAAALAAFLVLRRRRRPRAVFDEDAIVGAAHGLVRRGVAPARAAEELTRTYADAVSFLRDLGPELMNDPRYPYFRTRLGRSRLQEIRDLLADKSAESPRLGATVASILASAVTERTAPPAAADTLAARAASDEWTAFAGMDLEKLTEALRSVSREHPALATPRARGIAVAIQDALRERGSNRPGVVVGWLVRASGVGRRGETLRIAGGHATVGSGDGCEIRIAGDPAVVARHADIALRGAEFSVRPISGPVSVEGKPIDGPHVLADGETIHIGGGLFVFKSASAGPLSDVSGRFASTGGGSRSQT